MALKGLVLEFCTTCGSRTATPYPDGIHAKKSHTCYCKGNDLAPGPPDPPRVQIQPETVLLKRNIEDANVKERLKISLDKLKKALGNGLRK